jgi:hypothetical protein
MIWKQGSWLIYQSCFLGQGILVIVGGFFFGEHSQGGF